MCDCNLRDFEQTKTCQSVFHSCICIAYRHNENCRSIEHDCVCTMELSDKTTCRSQKHACACRFLSHSETVSDCLSVEHRCICGNGLYKCPPLYCKSTNHVCMCNDIYAESCRADDHCCTCSVKKIPNPCKTVDHNCICHEGDGMPGWHKFCRADEFHQHISKTAKNVICLCSKCNRPVKSANKR